MSVALHECGHMWVARATGMKVRRYFVGFGPTLWSTWRAEQARRPTEYGVKAVPLGGFCDIAGMTSVDELAPDEHDRTRCTSRRHGNGPRCSLAGPGMNFVIGLLLIYGIAVVWGLPNLHAPTTAIVGETSCVKAEVSKGQLGDCLAPSPAAAAGIRAGDTVVKIGDTPVANFDEMVTAIRRLDGPTPFTVQRDGGAFTTVVDVIPAQRWVASGDTTEPAPVGTVGITAARFGPTQYNALSAAPATVAFTGDLAVEIGKSLAKLPTKMGALVRSIGGEERDPETPISVVGASIIGGDAVDQGLWVAFWFFLAQLNFVLGAINLVPLLPFDGGHIAIAFYEKIRNTIRSARGKVAAAPVNYLRLMPATYVILVVVAGYMLLTVTADFINPIRIFQ